jgi:hypothetical protein
MLKGGSRPNSAQKHPNFVNIALIDDVPFNNNIIQLNRSDSVPKEPTLAMKRPDRQWLTRTKAERAQF